MLKTPGWVLLAATVSLSAAVQAGQGVQDAPGPVTVNIDVSARPAYANRLSECRLTGQAILWVSRPVQLLDDGQKSLGEIEAGLAQLGNGSRLEGCHPDGAVLDLSGQFVNILVAVDGAQENRGFETDTVEAIASQLARDFYHLAERDGTQIPLVDGIKVRAVGSFAYRFMVMLVRNAVSGSIDAVIARETEGTKFASRLPEGERRLSRLIWSSVQHDRSASIRTFKSAAAPERPAGF